MSSEWIKRSRVKRHNPTTVTFKPVIFTHFCLDYPLTVSETLKRNTQLERIEESGFVPASFISSRSGKKSQAEVCFKLK
jgi:hypothetical protein